MKINKIKEIKFSPNTDQHDIDTKVRHIRKFLMKGSKCRLIVAFKGREIAHPMLGTKLLGSVAQATSDIASVGSPSKLRGNQMMMMLHPRSR